MRTAPTDPQKFDARLADLHATLDKAHGKLASATDRVHRAAGDQQRYVGRRRVWRLTDDQARATVTGLAASGARLPSTFSYQDTAGSLLAAEAEIRATIHELGTEIGELDAIYRLAPWTRYFPCLNGDGHIHSSAFGCPTVRPTTRMGWTPKLSGKTVKDAVDELGPRLCTVCFPSAPVEWTAGRTDDQPAPCPGTGKTGTSRSRNNRYGSCPECGKHGALTPNWYVRKHQPRQEGDGS